MTSPVHTPTPSSDGVLVVGAGVIGWSIAWRLARRGVAITIIDPEPSGGTSRVGAGMLAPVAEAHHGEEALLTLNLASARRWAAFAADLAADARTDCGYTRHGTLVVARDADDLAALADLAALHEAHGLASERLTSRAARRREPALAAGVRGGLWLPDDHQVSNRRLLSALATAAVAAGVVVKRTAATAITAGTVETGDGMYEGRAVVVATGATPPPLVVGGATIRLPVRPVKGQILRVRSVATAVSPTRTVRGLDVYIVPRSTGEVVIGATQEERGDTAVTAGAVHDLLHDAVELVPGLYEAEWIEATAGLRPATPDNLPLIGRLGDEGPFVATGLFRNGLLLAPVTADLVVADVLGEATDVDDLRPALAPDRLPLTEQPAGPAASKAVAP